MNAFKVLIVVLFLAMASLLGLYSYLDMPVRRGADTVQFTVNTGESAASVATRLRSTGLIRSASLFRMLSTVNGLDGKIRAGMYTLSPAMGTQEMLFFLVNRNEVETEARVTIPEGFTAREIAERMEEKGLCSEAEWMDIVKAPENYNIALDGAMGTAAGAAELPSLEGFLFPDTYFFQRGAPCENHVQKMVNRFFEIFTPKAVQNANEQGFSLLEIVTLASLIEKEAKIESERRLISAVLRNRLARGMLLQCDATVIYAMPRRTKRVLYEDLKMDSPYNTYLYKGLPPGPIGCPGKSSLAAALNPAAVDYLYYVARGDGGHEFSSTAAGHEDAVIRTRSAREKQYNQ